MPKSSLQIQLDYKKAYSQAKSLDNIAANIEKEGKIHLPDCAQVLSSNWKGDSANQYTRKLVKVSDDVSSIARQIREVASAIREIADRIYDAEMEAIEIAETRTYGG